MRDRPAQTPGWMDEGGEQDWEGLPPPRSHSSVISLRAKLVPPPGKERPFLAGLSEVSLCLGGFAGACSVLAAGGSGMRKEPDGCSWQAAGCRPAVR